jgi:amidase
LVPAAIPRERPDFGTWTSFVFARSIRDLSATLDAVSNTEPALDLSTEGLCVGMLLHDTETPFPVHPGVVAAVRQAGSLLSARGHDVSESYPVALDHLWSGLADLPTPTEWDLDIAGYRCPEDAIGRPLQDGDVLPIHLRGRALAMPAQAEVYAAVASVTAEFKRTIEWWDTHDVLVMPVQRQPAWLLGQTDDYDWALVGRFPMQFTHIGYPSLALPIAMTEDGLPLGVQLVGRRRAHRQLLELAAQIEAGAPWADRWPPLVAANGVSDA